MKRLVLELAVLTLVLALAGCGEGGSGESGSKLLSYTADAGSSSEGILESGGLGIEAGCSESATGGTLTVTATTATDDAFLVSEFHAKHSPREGYRFVLDDFDRADGQYDFLGTSPEEASGTLHYAAADGGHVTIPFTAGRSQSGGCVFSGTAITPPDVDEPSQSLTMANDETGQATDASPTAFENCPPPKGGGHDVWVQGMDCSAVTTELLISMPDAFGRYRSLPESERQVSIEGPDGWVCWSALRGDFGPIQNVCRRESQTLIFFEG